jgi:hypothetical protein
MKERQNVLWITYIIDAGVSLRTGRPPAMSDKNISIELPVTTPNGYDHFRSMATLALLEARAYTELYSAEAATRSRLQRLKCIGRLDTELERWRDAMPPGYRPESQVSCPDDQLLPLTMLHFAYYNCVMAIHRASIDHGSWTNESDGSSPVAHGDEGLNPRVYASSTLCLQAARHTINVLKQFNRQFPKDGMIW